MHFFQPDETFHITFNASCMYIVQFLLILPQNIVHIQPVFDHMSLLFAYDMTSTTIRLLRRKFPQECVILRKLSN